MLQRVLATIRRHRMFNPGDALGIAVSGGADSIALLYLLNDLAPAWRLRLTVLHLNHQLRGPESDQDARFVDQTARALNLPILLEDAALGPGNLEQEGRRARRDFFRRAMGALGLQAVAVGHTRSDQAETVLFRLLRGAGPTGIAGILPVTSEGLIRPLIELDRHQVRQWLAARGISWCEDSSNTDTRFARNRIRSHLLPELEREWNPRLTAAFANLAEIARQEEAYWDREIALLAAIVERPPEVLIDLERVADVHPALLRRLLRHALRRAKGDLRAVNYHHIDSLLELVRGANGAGRVPIPGGIEACRSFQWLRLAPATWDRLPKLTDLDVPGEIPFGRRRIRTELLQRDSESGYNQIGTDLDWERLPIAPKLRAWVPGDRFQPAGESTARKLKILFQQERIPSWERRSWPMITSGSTVVWVHRFGTAEGFAPSPSTRWVLRITEEEMDDE